MGPLLGILRAFAVLIGLWSVLGIVAYLSGTMPPVSPAWQEAAPLLAANDAPPPVDAPEPAPAADEDEDRDGDEAEEAAPEPPRDDDDPTARSGDDGDGIVYPSGLGGGTPPRTPPTDEAKGAAAPSSLVAAKGDRTETTFVCEGDVPHPSLALVDVIGDPRPELAVGCGDRLLVLALRGKPPHPFRVATFETPTPGAGVRSSHMGRVTVGDLSGDGLPDLVVPFWHTGARDDVRGGGLYVVPRRPTGGFGDPIELVDVPVTDVRNIVERVGAITYLAALHRASSVARRRSEVFVFRGGASPERTAKLSTGVGAVALAIADLDGDRRRDLAALSGDDPQLDLFGGTGEGKYARRFTLPVRDGRDLLALDVDGDRQDDLIVVTPEGLSVVLGPDEDQGRGTASLRALTTPGSAPMPSLDDLTAFDVDGDDREDVVGVGEGTRIVAIPRSAPYAFAAPRPVLPRGWVPEGGTLAGYVLGDFAIDGRPDLAFVFRRTETAPWELALIPDVREAESPGPTDDPARLEDAPLTLTIPLIPAAS